jgi:hypothetical protein
LLVGYFIPIKIRVCINANELFSCIFVTTFFQHNYIFLLLASLVIINYTSVIFYRQISDQFCTAALATPWEKGVKLKRKEGNNSERVCCYAAVRCS